MRRAAAPAAAALLLLAGCDLTAQIEVPRIGVTIPSQHFPESYTLNPADFCDPTLPVNTDPPCVARSIDFDLGAQVPALTNDAVSYDLRLTDCAITLSTSSSTADLSGIQSVAVRVNDASGAVIASYTRPTTGMVSATSIAVAGNANIDLGPYLDAGVLPIRVQLVIDGATPAFDADVYAGISLVMDVDWGKYL